MLPVHKTGMKLAVTNPFLPDLLKIKILLIKCVVTVLNYFTKHIQALLL